MVGMKELTVVIFLSVFSILVAFFSNRLNIKTVLHSLERIETDCLDISFMFFI